MPLRLEAKKKNTAYSCAASCCHEWTVGLVGLVGRVGLVGLGLSKATADPPSWEHPEMQQLEPETAETILINMQCRTATTKGPDFWWNDLRNPWKRSNHPETAVISIDIIDFQVISWQVRVCVACAGSLAGPHDVGQDIVQKLATATPQNWQNWQTVRKNGSKNTQNMHRKYAKHAQNKEAANCQTNPMTTKTIHKQLWKKSKKCSSQHLIIYMLHRAYSGRTPLNNTTFLQLRCSFWTSTSGSAQAGWKKRREKAARSWVSEWSFNIVPSTEPQKLVAAAYTPHRWKLH